MNKATLFAAGALLATAGLSVSSSYAEVRLGEKGEAELWRGSGRPRLSLYYWFTTPDGVTYCIESPRDCRPKIEPPIIVSAQGDSVLKAVGRNVEPSEVVNQPLGW